MITKKKWYRLWDEYSELTQRKEQQGVFFSEETRLNEVKEQLYCAFRTVSERLMLAGMKYIEQGYVHNPVMNKFHQLKVLANKYDSGKPVFKEDYEGTYYTEFPRILVACVVGVIFFVVWRIAYT